MPPSHAPRSLQYRFSVAPLPRPVYNALKDLLAQHQGLSMWEAVVMAVLLLLETARTNPTKLEEVLEKVKNSY